MEFNIPDYTINFIRNLKKIDIPDPCNYLEIGICEGRSAIHMLDKYLQHDKSRYTGIDIRPLPNIFTNLEPYKDKTTIMIGDSAVCMEKLEEEQFDLIYIDGNHHLHFVYSDSFYAFRLLKNGGTIIWDDYEHKDYKVKEAIELFLHNNKWIGFEYEILFKNWQIGCKIRKING